MQQNMFTVDVLVEHNKTVGKVCSIQGKKKNTTAFTWRVIHFGAGGACRLT